MAFLAAVASGVAWGHVEWKGALALAALGFVCWAAHQSELPAAWRGAAAAGVLVLAAGLSLHQVPGFSNPVVLRDVVLSPGAVPYSRYLNFDKAAVGLLMLAFAGGLIRDRREWARTLRRTAPIAAATIGSVLVLSLLLGYVRFEPTPPPFLALWAWTNLFFTCMSEEAIFRGFIQRRLERLFAAFRHGRAAALLIAAALFGVAHWSGGLTYVCLATVAGAGYGLAMRITGRVEGSILTHFALNLMHYALFTYPAIAQADLM